MEKWMKKSWFFQQELYHKLKDRCWDELNDGNITEKIQYSFVICYGNNYMQNKECEEMYRSTIKKVFEHYSCSKTKLFSSTFINSRIESDEKEHIHCVFWAQNGYHEPAVCIDTNGRLYKDWADFIDNNKLPKCQIMYPKGGKYVHHRDSVEEYVNLICEESTSCGLFDVFKTVIEVVGTVLSATTLVVLSINPVTGPLAKCAVGGAVAGGVISTTYAAGRLLDMQHYEGLDWTTKKTLFAVANVAISSVSTITFGVSGGCKLLTASGRWLGESVAAIKLADCTTVLSKVVSGVSSVYYILDIIYKYTTKKLNSANLQNFKLMLLFMYNITVSTPVAGKLIEFISSCSSLSGIVDNFVAAKDNVFAFSRSIRKFVVESDLNALLDFLLPIKVIPIVKRITEINPLKTVCKVLDNLNRQGSKDPIGLLYDLLNQMPMIFKEVDKYLNSSQQQLTKHCDTSMCRSIKRWTDTDGIDLSDELSMFDCKINLPVDLQNKVCNALKLLGDESDQQRLFEKRRFLVTTILTMIFKHDTRSYIYIANKADFYCDTFVNIFRSMMALLHWHYFRFTVDNGLTKSRNMFFEEELGMKQDVLDHVFHESIVILQNCVNDLHAEYDCIFNKSKISESTVADRLVFKWQVPKCTTLNEELFYATASKHLPNISTKITKMNTLFESHYDHRLAIISSIKDNFKLIFYSVEDNSNINGLLVYVDT